MKFICFGYFDTKAMGAKSGAELDAIMDQCRPHMARMYETGSVILDAGLAVEGRRLRRVRGQVVTTDGPFSETKELIGGVFIIEADDIEQAVRIAAMHPTTQVPIGEGLGWHLEVRPIDYFKD